MTGREPIPDDTEIPLGQGDPGHQGRQVIELEFGVLVYPPEAEGEKWRAVFCENGKRRFRESGTEAGLARKLEPVLVRLRAGAVNMERPGADLIAHYLDPDRLPVSKRWSRKHADTQRRLCARFAAPVITDLACQDITVACTQEIVNAAPTSGEGDRTHRMVSAMVTAGIKAGYLTSRGLAEVHWQPGERSVPGPKAAVAGEAAVWVDPAEIPAHDDVHKLALALNTGPLGDRHELMAQLAAYSGLRWGEIIALTADQVDPGGRAITVNRKVIEVAGKLYVEAPKARKFRQTIYPRRTPLGYQLADKLTSRVEKAQAEQEAGVNPLALLFPSPRFKYWRSSNFCRRVLQRAYLAAGWRDGTEEDDEEGLWTWHSLRHVFCTTALFDWKLDATDVSRMAGHSNYRITLDMYVGTTAGVLDRARTATE
jgi:integrase